MTSAARRTTLRLEELEDRTVPALLGNQVFPADNPWIGATNFNRAAVNSNNVRTEFYAVGLRNPSGTLIDSMAYGMLTAANNFTEGANPAPAPSVDQSISRLPNGKDSDQNGADFAVTAIPPRAANQ